MRKSSNSPVIVIKFRCYHFWKFLEVGFQNGSVIKMFFFQIVRMKTFSNIIFWGKIWVSWLQNYYFRHQKMFQKDTCLKNFPTWISWRKTDILGRRKLVWLKWVTQCCRKQKKFIWWSSSNGWCEVLKVLCSLEIALQKRIVTLGMPDKTLLCSRHKPSVYV